MDLYEIEVWDEDKLIYKVFWVPQSRNDEPINTVKELVEKYIFAGKDIHIKSKFSTV